MIPDELGCGVRLETYAELQARLAQMRPMIELDRLAADLNARERTRTAVYRALVRRRSRRRAYTLLRSIVCLPPTDAGLHHTVTAALTAVAADRTGPPLDPLHVIRCTPVRGPTRTSRIRLVHSGAPA